MKFKDEALASLPMNILSKVIIFVKGHLNDIILVIGVVLISLLSFAMGYILAKQQEKTPLQINEVRNYWSRNNGIISGLEIS